MVEKFRKHMTFTAQEIAERLGLVDCTNVDDIRLWVEDDGNFLHVLVSADEPQADTGWFLLHRSHYVEISSP